MVACQSVVGGHIGGDGSRAEERGTIRVSHGGYGDDGNVIIIDCCVPVGVVRTLFKTNVWWKKWKK